MDVGTLALLAFAGLFVLWVVVPTFLLKRRASQEETSAADEA